MDRALTNIVLDEIISLGVGTRFSSSDIRQRLEEKGITVSPRDMTSVVRRYKDVYFAIERKRAHYGNVYIVTKGKRIR